MTTHRYTLKATPSEHPIRQRPFYGAIRGALQQLERVALEDLDRLERLFKIGGLGPQPTPTPAPSSPADPVPPASPISPAAAAPLNMVPLLRPTLDQGQEGDCGGFAWCAAKALLAGIVAGSMAAADFSQQFAYWVARVIMGTTTQDSGVDLGDLLQAAEQSGTCLEQTYPYVAGQFTETPPPAAYLEAASMCFTGKAYPIDLSDPANIDRALEDGCPILFGFEVWQGFEDTGSDGMIPTPDGSDLGGHAQLFYYDPAAPAGTWANQNSWGPSWGLSGRGRFPKSALSTITEAYALVAVTA